EGLLVSLLKLLGFLVEFGLGEGDFAVADLGNGGGELLGEGDADTESQYEQGTDNLAKHGIDPSHPRKIGQGDHGTAPRHPNLEPLPHQRAAGFIHAGTNPAARPALVRVSWRSRGWAEGRSCSGKASESLP